MTKEMTEIEELKKRVAELEKAANPEPRKPSTWQPVDYTAGFSMPASALKAMVDVIPSSVMAGIVADARKPNPVTGGMTKSVVTEPPKTMGKNGWVDARPLTPPEGIGLVDQIAEGFAKRERRGG